jgi:hypothetical protein
MESVEESLVALETRGDPHQFVGQALYDACAGDLFPCDMLAMAVLDRSVNLLGGFLVLMRNHGYTTGAALLRMQLDNVLRLHGVIAATSDPHGVAEQVFGGTHVRKIKDKSGQPMTDARLQELLEPKAPGIKEIYSQASGYVHLSREHVLHFIRRSPADANGSRIFTIGNNDDHLTPEHKLALIKAFDVVTGAVLDVVGLWTRVRSSFGDADTLRARFSAPILDGSRPRGSDP